MSSMHDNVIYLETDEDITSAIDKLTKASGGDIQVVMPKRSTLLQSLINQKLLKKAAADNKKTVTLVTTDRVITNLASRVGLPVASKVGDTGSVPKSAPTPLSDDDEIDGGAVETKPTPPPTPVATKAAEVAAEKGELPTEPISNAPEPAAVPAQPSVTRSPVAAAPKAKSGAKVPNLSRLQKRIAWGAGAAILLIGLLIANTLLTSSKVTLYAKATSTPVSFGFTAAEGSASSDTSVATTTQEQSKSVSAQVGATGKKDAGSKASGSIVISNSYDSSPHPLVAGTRFVTSDGKVFRSTADTVVPGGTAQLSGGGVTIKPGTVTVNVESDVASDQYNVGPTNYTLPGLAGDQQAKITGRGGQMQGGTTKTITVVTQADVDKAKQSALDNNKDSAQGDLASKAGKDVTVLPGSFTAVATGMNTSANVGDEASQVQATVQVKYALLTVTKSDLKALVRGQAQKAAGDNNQLYEDGTEDIKLAAGKNATSFTATTTAYAGPKIDTADVATQIKGKKYSEAMDTAGKVAGVESVEITMSPAWATKVPGNTKKIKITVKAANR